MKEKYKKYLNYDYSFDKLTTLGIFSLIIVIAGTFGFIYEFIFYYFNGGMKEFFLERWEFLTLDKYICYRVNYDLLFNL